MTLAIIYDWTWAWSLFVLLGLVYMFYSDEIHIVETIKKSESPSMYWFTFSFLFIMNVVLMLIYLNVVSF